MAAGAGVGQTKMDLADAGAARAIDLLGDVDLVSVHAVDSEAHEVVPLTMVGPSRRALREVFEEHHRASVSPIWFDEAGHPVDAWGTEFRVAHDIQCCVARSPSPASQADRDGDSLTIGGLMLTVARAQV